MPAEFDSMTAKLIAFGHDRRETLARLRRALHESAIVVQGGTTNRAFLLDLVDRPELRSGAVDTRWLERTTSGPAMVVRVKVRPGDAVREGDPVLANLRDVRPPFPHPGGDGLTRPDQLGPPPVPSDAGSAAVRAGTPTTAE